MNGPATQQKRPYLSRDKRRLLLLDTAAGIVEEEGWDRLSMSALAQRAQTSRQLVYQHFESLEDLMTETGTHIFQQVYVETQAAINRHDEDIVSHLGNAMSITLDLPSGRAQALWQIIACPFPRDHAMNRFSRRMRHLITNLWKPAVAHAFGLDDETAASVSWMLIMAFWGGWRQVQDAEITRQQAIQHLQWIVTGIAASHETST